MTIDPDIDGGSILVLDAGDDGDETALALRPDSAADLRQWFCFRSRGAPGEVRRFRIENAGEAEYPGGWEDYRACASYDGEDWFRVPTSYEEGVLRFELAPERPLVTFASFAPYPVARLRRLAARAARFGRARARVIGETVQGRPIPAITFGDGGPYAARIWIIARQHPGETMATWCAEGIVDRLLDGDDPVADALRDEAIVTVVPCVNIDGGVLGNHRTNAAGRDLNRAWHAPDLVETPEVFAVRAALLETGADMFLDLHGDEDVPFVFAAGNEGNPSYSSRLAALEVAFKEELHRLNPSFSLADGYPPDAPGEADLSCAANWVGERFDCLSLTLEMPFKDESRRPRTSRGWSPGRSRGLGRSVLEAALALLPALR